MSNVNKEYESRIMLTESEYDKILSHFMRLYPERKLFTNANTYFDTADLFLRKHHSNLRVRAIDDSKYELTLKIGHSEGDDEFNDYLDKKAVDSLFKTGVFPDGVVKKYLSTLPYQLSDFKKITTLTTIRLEIPFDDHLLVIDKNSYGDVVDFNLEIEAKESLDVANKRLHEYMQQFNIAEPTQKYIGKSHRAIDAATKRN